MIRVGFAVHRKRDRYSKGQSTARCSVRSCIMTVVSLTAIALSLGFAFAALPPFASSAHAETQSDETQYATRNNGDPASSSSKNEIAGERTTARIVYREDGSLSANTDDLFEFADVAMPGTSPKAAFTLANEASSACRFSLHIDRAFAETAGTEDALDAMGIVVSNLETKQVLYEGDFGQASKEPVSLCTLEPDQSCALAICISIPAALDNPYAGSTYRSPWTIVAQEEDVPAESNASLPAKTGAPAWIVAVPCALVLSGLVLALAFILRKARNKIE